MEKLKQISLKINSDTIDKIDEMAKGNSYWKRNTIINQILTAMMHYASEDSLFDIMLFNPGPFQRIEITVKLIK